MSFVQTADGVSLFYKNWGPKNAQPFVFHNGSSTARKEGQPISFRGYGGGANEHLKLHPRNLSRRAGVGLASAKRFVAEGAHVMCERRVSGSIWSTQIVKTGRSKTAKRSMRGGRHKCALGQ